MTMLWYAVYVFRSKQVFIIRSTDSLSLASNVSRNRMNLLQNQELVVVQNKSSAKNSCDAVIKNLNISSKKFVMGLSYWEQLTMATNSFISLIAYSKNLGARTVEPFLLASELYGLPTTVNFPTVVGTPPIKYMQRTRDLKTIYDMEALQRDLCTEYALPPLASFNEFLANASRELTVLNIMYHHAKKDHDYSNCSQAKEIKSSSKKLLKILNAEAAKHKISKEKFTVKRACCIHKKQDTIPEEMARRCGFNGDSFSAIFMVWRGYSHDPNKRFRLRLPNLPIFNMPFPGTYVYPLSPSVLSNATAFYNNIAKGKELISVHLRTAKLGMEYQEASRAKPCFEEVWRQVDQLRKDYPNAVVKYFVDYSPFGSHSFEVSYGRKVSVGELKRKKIKPEYYRVKEYGGVEDQAFVALVEQAAIAKSEVLVLVGGGSFQSQMSYRLKATENGSKVYRVNCVYKEKPQTVLLFDRAKQ